MDITVTILRDDAYLRRLVRDTRRPYLWGMLVTLVAWGLVAALCFLAGGRTVVAGLLVVGIAALSWQNSVLPALRETSAPEFLREPQELTLTGEHVSLASESRSTRVTWTLVARVQERPYAYLLWGAARAYHDIPRAALSPAQDAQLRRFLLERRLLRPANGAPLPATTQPASASEG